MFIEILVITEMFVNSRFSYMEEIAPCIYDGLPGIVVGKLMVVRISLSVYCEYYCMTFLFLQLKFNYQLYKILLVLLWLYLWIIDIRRKQSLISNLETSILVKYIMYVITLFMHCGVSSLMIKLEIISHRKRFMTCKLYKRIFILI